MIVTPVCLLGANCWEQAATGKWRDELERERERSPHTPLVLPYIEFPKQVLVLAESGDYGDYENIFTCGGLARRSIRAPCLSSVILINDDMITS